eukprot:11649213-Prorocentrum_lima.AAC.1
MRCIQCPTFKNVWKVVSSLSKEVMGFFMVNVDDVLMFGSTPMVKKIIDAFRKPRKCRVIGIIPREVAEKLVMHQRPYLENKLK